MELARLELRDGKVVREERLFGEALKKRIRAVVNGPDGALVPAHRRQPGPVAAGDGGEVTLFQRYQSPAVVALPRGALMRRIRAAAGL